jgi:hypothetical protein
MRLQRSCPNDSYRFKLSACKLSRYKGSPQILDNAAWQARAYSRTTLLRSSANSLGPFSSSFVAFAGTQTACAGQTKLSTETGTELAQLLYVALSFGFSLTADVWLFYRISGELFNPAVSPECWQCRYMIQRNVDRKTLLQ